MLRRVKHLAFVGRKRSRRWARRTKFRIATVAFQHVEVVRPYRYRSERYLRGPHAQRWLIHDARPCNESEFPFRVFSIWAGDNPLTEARKRNVSVLKDRLGVEHVLVTPGNLDEWLVEGQPLHPAYESLSMIHRSDYLRGYLMHHHGGGYVDIKEPLHPWVPSFADMAADADCWVMSYPTTDANWVGKLRGPIGRDLVVRHRSMFGKSGFMMRSYTPLTAEWMAEMERRLDLAADALAMRPADNPFGGQDYPISWNDLLARVLDPLTLKHAAHIRLDARMLLRFEDYR